MVERTYHMVELHFFISFSLASSLKVYETDLKQICLFWGRPNADEKVIWIRYKTVSVAKQVRFIKPLQTVCFYAVPSG